MTVLYLYEHVKNLEVLKIVIHALQRFRIEELADWIPIIVYIYCISRSQTIENFLQELAIKCIPLYLRIRWSYSAYIDDEDEL
jgi:hypothetical protein